MSWPDVTLCVSLIVGGGGAARKLEHKKGPVRGLSGGSSGRLFTGAPPTRPGRAPSATLELSDQINDSNISQHPPDSRGGGAEQEIGANLAAAAAGFSSRRNSRPAIRG